MTGIRSKLAAFTLLIILFVAGSLTFFTIRADRERAIEGYQKEGLGIATSMAGFLVGDLYKLNIKGLRYSLEHVRTNPDVSRVYVLDQRGLVLTDGTNENPLRDQRLEDPFADRLMQSKTWISEITETTFKIGGPISLDEKFVFGGLYLEMSLESLNQVLDIRLRESLIISAICVAIGIILTFVFTARFTKPIRDLTQAANLIRQGHDGVEIPVSGNDEIGVLARALDDALSHLGSSNRELKDFTDSLDRMVRERTEDLMASEERLVEAIETINEGFALYDKEDRLVLCNSRYRSFFGFDQSESQVGRRFEDIVRDNIRRGVIKGVAEDGIEQYVQDRLSERDKGFGPTERRLSDGRWILLSDHKTKSGETVSVRTDITELKQREEAVTEAQERLTKAIESLNDGFALYDADDRLVLCNTRYREIYGAAEDEYLPGMTFEGMVRRNVEKGIVNGVLDVDVEDFVKQRMEERKHEVGPIERRLQNGTWILITDLKTDSGEMVSVRTEITELKKREEALQHSEERFSKAFRSSPVIMAIADPKTHAIVDVNDTWLAAFNFSRDEVIGKDVPSLGLWVYEDERAQFFTALEINGAVRNFETVLRKKTGEIMDVLFSTEFVEIGGKMRMVAVTQDITARKEAERVKSEFISTVNHELRTPLTSIQGSLALILKSSPEDIPTKFKNLVNIAYRNAGRLVRLINDILDVDKIEAGKMPIQLSPQSLKALVDNALESNKSYGDQHEVRFKLTQTLPGAVVNADPDRFDQIMSNLLSNAAKFSSKGGAVDISLSQAGESYRIAVKDHGEGIPEDFQKQIFEKFLQVDSTSTRKHDGTGLGLAITKALVEMHGGRIGFESKEGEGTTFYFDLPVLQALDADTAMAFGKADDFRVLICEDDPDIASLLQMIMSKDGVQCDIAYSSAEALARLDERRYSAITVDLVLPDRDGMSLIQELRSREDTFDLPVVVVSARAEDGRRELNGDAFGIIDWLQKPIDQDRLIAALMQVQRRSDNGTCRVLHVEDDEELVHVVANYLDEIAVVESASTIEEARRKVKDGQFDMVLLDVGMPDGSGLELVPEINKLEGGPIPVVLFTAQDVPSEVARQVDAVLTKSRYSIENLAETVKGIIGRE